MTSDELAAIYAAKDAFEKDAMTQLAAKVDELDALIGTLMDTFPEGAKGSVAFMALATARQLNQSNYALNDQVTKFAITRTSVQPVDLTQM